MPESIKTWNKLLLSFMKVEVLIFLEDRQQDLAFSLFALWVIICLLLLQSQIILLKLQYDDLGEIYSVQSASY